MFTLVECNSITILYQFIHHKKRNFLIQYIFIVKKIILKHYSIMSEGDDVTVSSISSGNSNSPQKSGFFRKMKKSFKKTSKKKIISPKVGKSSEPSSSSTTTSSLSPSRFFTKRRIVKGHVPPSIEKESVQHDNVTESTSFDDSTDENGNEGHNVVTKIVQEEALREKTEQWRQERLDNVVALHKKHKEKDIMEHRRSKSSEQDHNVTTNTSKTDDEVVKHERKWSISSIFSVESRFPEHKRTVIEASLEEEPCGKKSKVSTDEDNNKSDTNRALQSKKDTTWLRYAVPAAAVIAIASIVAMKVLRKR